MMKQFLDKLCGVIRLCRDTNNWDTVEKYINDHIAELPDGVIAIKSLGFHWKKSMKPGFYLLIKFEYVYLDVKIMYDVSGIDIRSIPYFTGINGYVGYLGQVIGRQWIVNQIDDVIVKKDE